MTSWADYFNTYEDYCHYAGIDTPAQLEAEARQEAIEASIEEQDAMEARGGPRIRTAYEVNGDDIPF